MLENKSEFSVIFFKKDKFDLIEKKTFWLSDNPTIPETYSWGSNEVEFNFNFILF